MKDFDEERATLPRGGEFKIAGQTFRYGAMIPADVLAELLDADVSSTGLEIASLDTFIGHCLLNDTERERWKLARSMNAAEPLTLYDMRGVGRYLMEAMSGRPTESSSASGGTQASTTTPSTVLSPSVVAA